MINVEETIRKMTGWCPQKYSAQAQVNGSAHVWLSNLNPSRVGNPMTNQTRLPLDMFDWRELAVIIALGISTLALISLNYLNRTATTYFGIIILYFTFIIVFNLLDRNKVSVDSEKLVINTSFFESIKISKRNINSIKTMENISYKYKWINFILIILILLLVFVQALSLYRQVTRSSVEDALLSIANAMFLLFILISVSYRSNCRSRYPEAIQVEAGNKNITLYPRNEFEFYMLKEELER